LFFEGRPNLKFIDGSDIQNSSRKIPKNGVYAETIYLVLLIFFAVLLQILKKMKNIPFHLFK